MTELDPAVEDNRDSNDKCLLGIFVKYPEPGRVKTRLAETIGAEQAAKYYAAFLQDIITRFRTSGQERRLCYAPDADRAMQYFQKLAQNDYQLWLQPECPLGTRLEKLFEEAFDRGAVRVVVIGSDSPTLPKTHVDEAFALLGNHDVVLGPATDGGYYLIGMSIRRYALFDEINWSQPTVLAETMRKLKALGSRVALLPPWYDIDSASDLQMLWGHLCAMHLSSNEPGQHSSSHNLTMNPATYTVLKSTFSPEAAPD